MTPNQIIDQTKVKFTQAVSHFQDELKKIRTGRAHPGMLDGLMVEAYGSQMPLIQVGSITVPEAQLLQITPFDPGNLQAISTAIRNNQSLGMNPADDGRVVRVPIPSLTEDRRKEYVKVLNGKAEDTLISMRSARHDALKEAEESKKKREITEDDLNSVKKQLDELMAKEKAQIDGLAKAKGQEILTV
jgi:ribosome recycling factor